MRIKGLLGVALVCCSGGCGVASDGDVATAEVVVSQNAQALTTTATPDPNSGIIDIQFERENFLALLGNEIAELVLAEAKVGETAIKNGYYLEGGMLTFDSKALLGNPPASGQLQLQGTATVFVTTRADVLATAPLEEPATSAHQGQLRPSIALLTNPMRLEIREDTPLLLNVVSVPPFVREVPLALSFGNSKDARTAIHASSSEGELSTITLRIATDGGDDLAVPSPSRLGTGTWGFFLAGGVFARSLAQEIDGGEPGWWSAEIASFHGLSGPFASAAREQSGFRIQANLVPTANLAAHQLDLLGRIQVLSTTLTQFLPGPFKVKAYREVQASVEAKQGGAMSIANVTRNDNTISFTGRTPLPDSPHGQTFYATNDTATVDDDGISLVGRIRHLRKSVSWNSVSMGYGRCNGQPTAAYVDVTTSSAGRLPRLVAPVETWYGAGLPGPVKEGESNPTAEVSNLPDGLHVTVSWDIAAHEEVSVLIATNVGTRRAVLRRPEPITGLPPWIVNWSECHPPVANPLDEINDCWMCQAEVRDFAAPVVLPPVDNGLTMSLGSQVITSAATSSSATPVRAASAVASQSLARARR